MIDTLCFSGGGVKGFAIIGVLEYLEKNNNLDILLIKNYVGTSCGAIISFLLSINYSINEIKEFILNFNFNILINDIDIDNIFINYGIDNGNKIIYILESFLKNKYNLINITFQEHYNLTNTKLTIIGTNYTKACEEVFNYNNTPNMSVITAIRISISVPLIFTPVLYNDNYYVDGALVNNFPINYCNINNTIGINITSLNNNNKLEDISTFINNCMHIILKKNNNSLNIIELNILNYNIMNFDITFKEKQKLINNGYNIAKKYINNLSYNICYSIINDIINYNIITMI